MLNARSRRRTLGIGENGEGRGQLGNLEAGLVGLGAHLLALVYLSGLLRRYFLRLGSGLP